MGGYLKWCSQLLCLWGEDMCRCGESRAKILGSVLNNRSTERWIGPWCFQEMQSDWSRGARGITLRTDSGYVSSCLCSAVQAYLTLCDPMDCSMPGVGMKTDHLESCSHCWVFQMCWHTECNTLTSSPFRIWNSSAGIPSCPLVLF